MSRSDDPHRGAPSNSELAERTARIEEQVGHVAETVDRIEESIDEDLDDVRGDVEEIKPRTTRLWLVYLAAKWAVVVGSGGGVLALLLSSAF